MSARTLLFALFFVPSLLAQGVAPLPNAVPLTIDAQPDDSPLRLRAEANATLLRVLIDLDDGWHLYTKAEAGGEPLGLRILDGSSFAAAGELRIPAAREGKLRGRSWIELPLRRTAPGGVLKAELTGMACDPLVCLPPLAIGMQTGELRAAAAALEVLVVTPEDAPRSERIRTWLARHDVKASFTTYEQVTAEQCRAARIVVADSPNADEGQFRASMRLRNKARALPATETPIVAVGYLGTELVEAHGLAMTSGYI